MEKLRAVLGQQGLIGRDDILATLQHLQRHGAIRLQAAHRLHHGHDFFVRKHLAQVVGQDARRQGHIAWAFQVGIDHVGQLHALARALGDAIAMLQQQPGHTRADGPKTDNGHFYSIHMPAHVTARA